MSNKNFDCEVEESSGNVFKDIGLPNPEIELLKAKLMHKINHIIKNSELSPYKVIKILDTLPYRISALKQDKSNKNLKVYEIVFSKRKSITLEKLFVSLFKLSYDIDITISKGKGELKVNKC